MSLSEWSPCQTQKSIFARRWSLSTYSLVCGVLLVLAVVESGCDATPNDVVASKSAAVDVPSGVVTLPADESSRVGLMVEPVTRTDFQTHRDFPGIVQPNQRNMIEITTLVRGRVVEVYADLGQQVKANATLAILYSSELGLAQSAYLKARAKLNVAEQSYSRAQFLLEEKVIGEAEAQRRHAELLSIQAESNEAHDRLKLLGMSPDEFRRLEKSREIRSVVPIVAPFAGRVIGRKLTRGEVVETTDNLFVIADLSEVWVLANIPEKDIPFVPALRPSGGMQADVRFNAYPGEVFKGRITYVGDVLDPSTRTMQLRLVLPNSDGRLKPEMFASVRLYSEAQPDRLAVPEAALQRDQGRIFVFVQRKPNEYEVRDVQVGESNGTHTSIVAGLTEGESVVTQG
ncbi:MAG: efflux RND transporter periplasmic adaptor subunit, partial [Nitrospira sp.]|nr:efflux RND transporter periplasmic adaptor subunit [Nitrospira sp.]